ncbi:MAG: hypothetical protein U5L74_12570 [Ideonella sp.]|nr:hypothetical protein [Ideonella sp.]
MQTTHSLIARVTTLRARDTLRLLALCCATTATATMAGQEQPGTIALVSSTAEGLARGGYEPCGLSTDGRFITFHSESKGLVQGDTNGIGDVFMKDISTGAVQRVNTSATGKQWAQSTFCKQVTPDARYVLLQREREVLLKDLQTGKVTTVSPAADSIAENTGFSAGSVSDDGQRVAFVTVPTQIYLGGYTWVNKVPARIMISDLATGSLSTLDTDNGRTADGEIVLGHQNARLSPDGTRVAFVSNANFLVPGDTNGQPDVFVRELATGTTILASSGSDGRGGELQVCCFQSYYHVEWANNQVLQFSTTQAHSLGPVGDYLKHLDSGRLELLLASADGAQPLVSPDLSTVVFSRLYGSGWDYRIYQRNRATGVEQVLSSSANGKLSNGNANLNLISRSGTQVAFNANASNLVRPKPPAGSYQVYVKTLAAP